MQIMPQVNFGRGEEAAMPLAVGNSPYLYTNDLARPVTLLISGGTVLDISISRGTSGWILAGLLAGQFMLQPGDSLRANYLIKPTVTVIPQ